MFYKRSYLPYLYTMPLNLITTQENKSRQIEQPLLNEFATVSIDDMLRFLAQRIINQVRHTPELIGILDTVVTDHFMGSIDFFNVDGRPLGPTKLKHAKRQWRDLKIRNAFYGSAIDYFAEGNAFGWTTDMNDNLTKQQKSILKILDSRFSKSTFKNIVSDKLKEPKKISYISASTTEILHDDTGVFAFKQEASGKTTLWAPRQIVHIKLMEMDGKVRGYSGIKALSKEIALMWMVRENMVAKLGNGGSADNIIAIENTMGAGKARFERMKTALESFSHLRKSHGNMPIEGKITVHPLGTALKDMEYRELAMFLISEFCLGVGMPISRIPFLMQGSGGNPNQGVISNNTEDAYQKKVNNRRTQWENEWNPIISKLGFTFAFRRDNLQDEIRETTAAVNRAVYTEKMLEVLLKVGKELNTDAIMEFLSGNKRNIEISDLVDANPERMAMSRGMGANPITGDKANNSSDMDLQSHPASDLSKMRKETANNNGVSV